ncbi:6-phosphogluconolactonase [uncultured Pseudoteredinibacter sp.]|uniref:6-phosphogluconolactonase n=1 Tax=uncultured Pseudoteredinibacter sp. TaxID=1641701 RepID=UPI002622FF3B|nr:6-phosphogluconolactonase [uncultured Pseudoteredinibacter sp.]
MLIELFFKSREEMQAAVQTLVMLSINTAQQERGAALLALSGGSSPQVLYESLAQQNLDWKNIHIALVDERWVDPAHSASNEGFLKRCFAHLNCADVDIVGLKNQADSVVEGLAESEERYRSFESAFDFALLGMGIDGHTASWFPHAEGLTDALSDDADSQNLLCAVQAKQSDVTGPYTERITLTKRAVLNAKTVVLMISGQEKFDVYQKAKKASPKDHPVAALLQQRDKDIRIFYAP